MISTYRSKQGNALIPAIFLLIFVAVFGAILLQDAIQSVTISTRISKIRQAEVLAKSGTDFVCDYLNGSQDSPLFINTDSILKKFSFAAPNVSFPIDINGNVINASITLLNRIENGSITSDEYLISTSATYMNEKGFSSRKIFAERTKSGIGKDKILGFTTKSARAREYVLMGSSPTSRAKIEGGVRVENAENVQVTNYIINGNSHIKASKGIDLRNCTINGDLYLESAKEINLTNSTINGSVHIASTARSSFTNTIVVGDFYFSFINSSTNSQIELNGINATGDIIAFTGLNSYFSGQISCNNLYLSGNAINAFNTRVTANSVFLGSGISKEMFGAGLGQDAVVYEGSEGENAVTAQKRSPVITKETEIVLTLPSDDDFDYEITRASANEFNSTQHDLNDDKSIDVNVKVPDSLNNIDVVGNGTLNLWVTKDVAANETIRLDLININRNGGNAVINFISLKNNIDFAVVNKVFDANIIASNAQVDLISAQLRGYVMAEQFKFDFSPGDSGEWGNTHIDSTVPWAHPGSLPGLGNGGVVYRYGPYS